MAIRRFKLDISKDVNFIPHEIVGRVGDIPKDSLEVSVTDNGVDLPLEGYKIIFEGTTSANTKVIDPLGAKVKSGNVFTYIFPDNFFTVAGVMKTAYFRIEKNKKSDSTNDIYINVLQNVDFNQVDANSVVTGMDEIIQKIVDETIIDVNEKLAKELEDIRNTMDELTPLVDGKLVEIKKVSATAEETISKAVVEANAQLDSKLSDLEGKIEGVDETVNGIVDKAKADLAQTVVDSKVVINTEVETALNRAFASLEESKVLFIKDLDDKAKALKLELEKLEKELEVKLKAYSDGLTGSIKTEVDRLSIIIDDVNTKTIEMVANVEQAKKDYDSLKPILDEVKPQVEAIRVELGEAETSIDNVNKRVDELNAEIESKGFVTEAILDTAIQGSNKYTDDKIANIPPTDLSNYYNKEQVDGKIADIPQVDLGNYYKKGEVDAKDTTVLTSAKKYADDKDVIAVASAKTYTDTAIKGIPQTDLSNYDTKTEVNAKDTVVLTNAKKYTDDKSATTLTTANKYADDKDVILSTATKKYADDKDVITLASAKSYTDSAIKSIPPVDLSAYDKSTQVDTKIKTKVDESLVTSKKYTDDEVAKISVPNILTRDNYDANSKIARNLFMGGITMNNFISIYFAEVKAPTATISHINVTPISKLLNVDLGKGNYFKTTFRYQEIAFYKIGSDYTPHLTSFEFIITKIQATGLYDIDVSIKPISGTLNNVTNINFNGAITLILA